jgi:hypothetical protein
MKTDQQMRLECMKLAAGMVQSKVITPANVTAKADELYQWVVKIEPLSAR